MNSTDAPRTATALNGSAEMSTEVLATLAEIGEAVNYGKRGGDGPSGKSERYFKRRALHQRHRQRAVGIGRAVDATREMCGRAGYPEPARRLFYARPAKHFDAARQPARGGD